MDTDTADAPAQDAATPPPDPPAVFINIGVPAHIEHLARNPPPRKMFVITTIPPEAELIRAVDTQPGQTRDSLRMVWIAARVYFDNEDEDHVLHRLAFSYLVSGHEWPLAVRAAILASCPLALHFEQRLAAIEERAAKTRKGPPPPIFTAG